MTITCGGCDRTWTGLAMAHCTACHETFVGYRAFDAHRSGPLNNRTCSTQGLQKDARGVWVSPERDRRYSAT